ncbi:hypothetical protein ACT4R9_03470 [Ornithobacterium rhinotracheale]|uniref:hypothetical protein n=1 Tax=Ornithobacterium rhinotracheale TaxID=28251 RepID=UPI001FF4E3AA|nr:hypothetical protein [Ornithobacterium rhinotracheale]MCK0203571.1 hypothetical protein [Ornithobacterium rhinotracheale]
MNKNQFFYNAQYNDMNGIILESRGGAKDSDNFRNPDYKLLRRYILETLKNENEDDVEIYVAANNSIYKNLLDRLICIDGITKFNFRNIDIDDFETKLNTAVRKKGQSPDATGGNDTKKLFFKTELIIDPLNDKKKTSNTHLDLSSIFEEFSFDYKSNQSVKELQEKLYTFLENKLPNYTWEMEYQPLSNRKDRIDIFGNNASENKSIVIELDPHRADSIAKKFVSRIAIFKDVDLLYVAFLYPGTKKMSKNEATKYCNDCSDIADLISKTSNISKKFISHFLK